MIILNETASYQWGRSHYCASNEWRILLVCDICKQSWTARKFKITQENNVFAREIMFGTKVWQLMIKLQATNEEVIIVSVMIGEFYMWKSSNFDLSSGTNTNKPLSCGSPYSRGAPGGD